MKDWLTPRSSSTGMIRLWSRRCPTCWRSRPSPLPSSPLAPTWRSSPERARRQARLQQVEALFDPLDFDVTAARSFGQVMAATTAAGRSHRSRIADLLIAAVAHANKLPLYTRNPQDFVGLSALITVEAV